MTTHRDRLPKLLEEDLRRAFLTDAAIHLINRKSIEALTKSVKSRYQDDPNFCETVDTGENVFRPTFVIDNGEAYSEEEINEVRLNNVMFRQVGPC